MRKVILASLVLMLLFVPISATASSGLTLSETIKAMEKARIEAGGADKTEDPVDWNRVIENECLIAPMYVCVDCNWFCVTVCAAEAVYADSWYHDTLFTKDCKITLLRSRGAMICPTCQKVWEQYDYHDCWEVHDKCNVGNYDVCPMEVS